MPSVFQFKSIRTKLISMMAIFVLVNVVALSMISYFSMRSAVEEQASMRLASVAQLKQREIEEFLMSIDSDLRLKAGQPFTAEVLESLTSAFHAFDDPLNSLQTTYIDSNPHPPGQRDQLLAANDWTEYDRIHVRAHEQFDELQDALGYYDVFLFDTEGNLIYSVFKERDNLRAAG